MGAARFDARWDVDRVVAVASALGLAAVAAVLLVDYRGGPLRVARADAIATLVQADGAVRCRAAGTLVWEGAARSQPLAAGDAVFVQPGGAATIAFRSGAVVELEERSLVVVEPPDAEAGRVQVQVLSGDVVASAGSAPFALRTGTEDARIAPGGVVSVEAGAPIALVAGRARIGGAEREGAPRLALATPARSHRLYVQRFPGRVSLKWDGEAARTARLEVSRERSFAARVATGPGAEGHFELEVDGPGTWYWRLAGAGGAAVSEVRKVMAIADRPPLPVSPAAGEILLAPQGVQVPFWWTAVAGVAGYRVEVSADAGFERIALSEPATGPGLWASLELPEGIYYWRVRAERSRDAEQRSPESAAVPFRLIRRPVLDAPQLFDATIEGADRGR